MPPIRREWLTVNALDSFLAVDSHTFGWKVVDYTALRGRTRVGTDRAIPGRAGRDPIPREWDEHRLALTWKIQGLFDKDGARYADSGIDTFDGVDLNHQFILDNLVNALDERDVLFHHRQGTEWDGSIIVENWEPSPDPDSGGDVLIAPLTLVIPAGWLTPA
jgi:hypothetical protein